MLVSVQLSSALATHHGETSSLVQVCFTFLSLEISFSMEEDTIDKICPRSVKIVTKT